MKMLIIGAVSDAGLITDGASKGAIKLGKYLESLNYNVTYLKNSKDFIKDKDTSNKRKNEKEINKFNKNLYKLIRTNKDKFPITIGGDHSVSIGSVLASQRNNKSLGLIWFDAHPDFNTFETTITGNIHGLPLASITAFGNSSLTKFHKFNYINPKNVVIIGARSIDKGELLNLKKAGIKVFTTKDIYELGIDYILKEALNIVLNNTNGFHLSYDLDVIDPLIAKGVSVKESNGIDLDIAYKTLEILLQSEKLLSFDLVEYNPLFDTDNQTFKIAVNLLNMITKKGF